MATLVTSKPLSLFLFVFWAISPIRRSLWSYAVGEIPLYFYLPMFPWKDFLTGWIKKIQKHKEERDRSRKFKKTRRKEWRKEREEIFAYLEVPILMCSPLVGDAMGLPLWWDNPSGEPTHMGTSSTTAQDWKKSTAPPVLLINPYIQVLCT